MEQALPDSLDPEPFGDSPEGARCASLASRVDALLSPPYNQSEPSKTHHPACAFSMSVNSVVVRHMVALFALTACANLCQAGTNRGACPAEAGVSVDMINVSDYAASNADV